MDKITIGDIEIDVVKKNIKNIHLSVHPPNGRVRIAAPKRMNDEAIRIFAITKLSWIKTQRIRFNSQARQSERNFVSGESHYYQGVRYLLNVIYTNTKQRVELCGKKYINLYVREGASKEQRESVMLEWYRKQLKSQIPAIIEKWEKRIGVEVESWGVRLMKTKWGSCNPEARRIWVNLELAKVNPRCLEYVIVHEMVHLLERHHNDRFIDYMDQHLPNWRSIRDELNSLIFESSKWSY